MQYLIISLIAGFCLLALLLTVFFYAGKKSKKQRAADLQLVQDCGDESLLRLYQQAESENERDGIVEFIKEKLNREEQDLAVLPIDLAPDGDLPTAETTRAETTTEAEAGLPPEKTPEISAAQRRSIPGVSNHIGNSSVPADTGQAIVSGHTAYGDPGETHMLALETIDWQAIELELQQRREEEARIMAQNQQIQEVFSKIRDVEERLIAEPQAENKQ